MLLVGSLGFVWVIPWYFLVYSSPGEHPRISLQEKMFILKTNQTSATVSLKEICPVKYLMNSILVLFCLQIR